MEKGKSKSWSKDRIMTIIAVSFLVIIAGFLLFVFLNRSETTSSDGGSGSSVGALDCKATSPVGPFFVSENALTSEHEVKVTFLRDVVDKLSYNYYGTFASEGVAENVRTNLHANYNIYMGKYNLNQESLSPTFTYNGNNAKVNLFVNREKLNNITARLFFLNPDEAANISNYSSDQLKSLYTGKGFSCTFHQ